MQALRALTLAMLVPALAAWTPVQEESRVDGAKRIAIYRTAMDAPMTYNNWMKYSPEIILECRSGVTWVVLNFDRVMGGRGQTIAYRVDKKPPGRIWMANSTDYKAFIVTGGAALAFARQLIDGEVLHVRATPHASGDIEVSFSLSGIKEAIEPIVKACKWPTPAQAAAAARAAREREAANRRHYECLTANSFQAEKCAHLNPDKAEAARDVERARRREANQARWLAEMEAYRKCIKDRPFRMSTCGSHPKYPTD